MAFRFLHGGESHLCDDVPPRLVPPCPRCDSLDSVVSRTGDTVTTGEIHTAPAALSCCGLEGSIELSPDTIFGVEEDEAVLVYGRARVYWGTADGKRP